MSSIKRGFVWGGIGVAVLILASLAQGSSPEDSSTIVSPAPPSIDAPSVDPAMGSDSPEPDESTPQDTEQTEPEPAPTAPEASPLPAGENSTALQALSAIAVKGRAPKTGFDRELQFGEAWLDVDANGCDTRNDILRRDLDNVAGDSRCRVLSGILMDPFSGEEISFVRGETTSILVQIDHVVSLSNAWQTGAQQLDQTTRIRLANDPLNLIAVSGRLNAQKGDSDAASWLPPHRGFWCEYVARQVGVKAHYGLWMTQGEHDRIEAILTTCPDFPALTPETDGRYRPGEIPLP